MWPQESRPKRFMGYNFNSTVYRDMRIHVKRFCYTLLAIILTFFLLPIPLSLHFIQYHFHSSIAVEKTTAEKQNYAKIVEAISASLIDLNGKRVCCMRLLPDNTRHECIRSFPAYHCLTHYSSSVMW